MRCYKGETFVDAMVQIRRKQTGDQSPPGCGALWCIAAKGDVVATTVSLGNTLKHAVSAPSAEHSATVPMGVGAEREDLVSPAGTGSPTQTSTSVLRGVSAHSLGAISPAGDRANMTDNLRKTEGCSDIKRAVGQHCPQCTLQRSTVQTPCWSANIFRGSGQWRGDCELRFSGRCA